MVGSKNPDTDLTANQFRFIQEYAIDLDGPKAAVRAGYSARTASACATRLLKHVKVRAAILKITKTKTKEAGVDAAWLLRRLADEAEADVQDLFGKDGKIKSIEEWPEIWRKGLVAGMDVETLYEGKGKDREAVGTVAKVRLSDRVKRLELIGRHVNVQAFRDQLGHSGPDGGPIQVQAVDLTKLTDKELKALELIVGKATNPG